MDLASTIIAIIFIAALVFGIIFYIWKTKDKNRPSYMVDKKVKPSKEEKAAAKAEKKAGKSENPAKASKKVKQ